MKNEKSFMSTKKLITAVITVTTGLLMLGQAAYAQEYTKIKRLGTSQSLCVGGVETAAQLQQYVASNPNVIRQVLSDSGWAGNADDVLTAIANGEMVEQAYPVGTKMAWMGANVKGTPEAMPYREWAGSKSFPGFSMNVSSGCQLYEFAIPKACCNIALIGVSPDESQACKPVVVAPPEPEPVVEPAPVAKALALIPFVGIFAGSETRPRFEQAWNKDMKDSSGIVGIRAGLIKELSAKTSIFGQVSFYDRNGINEFNVYPEDNLSIDIGIDRKLSQKTFIGGGIGIWNVDDSDFSDASLFGHVGGDIGKSNFQWFLEGRVFDSDSDNLDSLSDNKMFSGGIRYLIK